MPSCSRTVLLVRTPCSTAGSSMASRGPLALDVPEQRLDQPKAVGCRSAEVLAMAHITAGSTLDSPTAADKTVKDLGQALSSGHATGKASALLAAAPATDRSEKDTDVDRSKVRKPGTSGTRHCLDNCSRTASRHLPTVRECAPALHGRLTAPQGDLQHVEGQVGAQMVASCQPAIMRENTSMTNRRRRTAPTL
jgi:hypothetical protein